MTLFFLYWTIVLGPFSGPINPGEIVESQATFLSQGQSIAVEKFEPRVDGRYPAVLILHGAGGMEIGGPEFREFGRELARRGYVAQVVHYFDQTGTIRADASAIGLNYSKWMITLGDALTAVARQPNVDPDRVGLLGFSLGSYLSLSIASHDSRVSAVVEYFGGLPDVFTWNLQKFPPTLILHGDVDKVVPVTEARKLERLLGGKHFPFEIQIYPGQGHRFVGEADKDAFQRSIRFFAQHLQTPRPKTSVIKP